MPIVVRATRTQNLRGEKNSQISRIKMIFSILFKFSATLFVILVMSIGYITDMARMTKNVTKNELQKQKIIPHFNNHNLG